MKIRRNVASVPRRSAKDTWHVIIDLVTGAGTVDRNQLNAAASIMESLIADEHPATAPIVFKGTGSRVVIYCLYNEAAMEAGLAVDPLNTNPTAGDWCATAPCEAVDADWMNKTLKNRAARITVHDVGQAPEEEESSMATPAIPDFEINWKALAKS
jgi:hypothetical protein